MNKTKLSEVISIISGGTPKTSIPEYWNGSINWLSVVDFSNKNKYVETSEKTITEEGLKNSSTKLLNKNDIIISARGTVGTMAILKKPMAFNQSCFGLRAKPQFLNQDFLFYFLKFYMENIKAKTQGSIFETINLLTFDMLEITYPSLSIQNKIANILSKIDDKIELNNKINKELENMVKTIYDYWFLQFEFPNGEGKSYKSSGGKMVWSEELKKEIPENWEVKKLGQLIIENEKSSIQVNQIKNNSIGKIPFFTSGNTILYTSNYLVNGQNCFLNTGGNADVKSYYGKASYSTDTWCITSNEETIYYLSMYLSSIKNILNIKYFQGTGLKHLQKDLLKNTKMLYPNKLLLEKFNNLTKNLFIKSSEVLRENQELISLRDYLLPLLMNGQVGFKD